MRSDPRPPGPFLRRLQEDRPFVAIELRPPRSGLSSTESMETWIDMHHAVRGLAGEDTAVFLTDNAVGEAEEENLHHLSANLAGSLPPERLVPFLTCKHSLDYCLLYAARAASQGLGALTVMGGDRGIGPPRCVEYSWELRQMIRARHPELDLGGWANTRRGVELQADLLAGRTELASGAAAADGGATGVAHRAAGAAGNAPSGAATNAEPRVPEFTGEFYLAQIVSHHDLEPVERFLAALRERGVRQTGMFGVFLYRNAKPAVLDRLGQFFPVPAEGITREFEAGTVPETIAARTIVALRRIGADKVYLSNLGTRRPGERLRRIREEVERLTAG